MPNKIYFLPAFAESPVRKGGDECEKGIHRSLGKGGFASAGSAEDVKMPGVETRGASLILVADRTKKVTKVQGLGMRLNKLIIEHMR